MGGDRRACSFVQLQVRFRLSAAGSDGNGDRWGYPPGTTIAGIVWKSAYTEMRVSIGNPTEHAYDDLNIVVRPADAVAEIGQDTNVSGVTFEDKNGATIRLLDINTKTGEKNAVPMILIATNAGYRLRCPHLAAHQVLRVVMALVDIKWDPPPRDPSAPADAHMYDPNHMVRTTFDDFSSYWFGFKNGDNFVPRAAPTAWLKVEGNYLSIHKPMSYSQKIPIGGIIKVQ
jgi:hypothetical protein